MRWFLHATSVQGRLGSVFLAFLLLLIASVTATFLGLEAQRQDARVLNLAGRQRMLLQQMTGLARVYANDPQVYAPVLQEAAGSFDQTLHLLRSGGEALDYAGRQAQITPVRDLTWAGELETMRQIWQIYQGYIARLLDSTGPAESAPVTRQIDELAGPAVEQADRVVRIYEDLSTRKLNRLRTFQLASLVAGLAVLGVGWWVTRRSIVQPLVDARQAALRIGRGQLEPAVEIDGPAELQILGAAMNTMRVQVLASQQELQQWAARLESRVQQRTREIEALAAVTQEITSQLSIDALLRSITEKARQLTASEVASLCLLDEKGRVLHLHSAAGPEAAIEQSDSPADDPFAKRVLQQACAHPCGLQTCSGFCEIIRPEYRVSHLAAPLHTRAQVIGAICVGSSQPDAFRPEMLAVLTQLAGAAAVALENSRLYQQAEQAAVLEERQRIAAEMHDGLLQTVSFLRIMAAWTSEHLNQGDVGLALSTLQQVERAVDQAEQETRRAIASLQDELPTHVTLQDQLRALADELSQIGPPVIFRSDARIPVVLPRQESEQALRVVREALLNAQHHSQADSITLALEETGEELSLLVEDRGVGFEVGAEVDDGRAHFGIKIMQARAARLGGRLEIRSSPGAGSQVRLTWTPSAALQSVEGG